MRHTTFEEDVVSAVGEAGEMNVVVIVNARALGGLHEEMVETGAVPVRVGDGVVGTGSHEKLAVVLGVGWNRRAGIAEVVVVESKAALQTAGDFRVSALPGSPF